MRDFVLGRKHDARESPVLGDLYLPGRLVPPQWLVDRAGAAVRSHRDVGIDCAMVAVVDKLDVFLAVVEQRIMVRREANPRRWTGLAAELLIGVFEVRDVPPLTVIHPTASVATSCHGRVRPQLGA